MELTQTQQQAVNTWVTSGASLSEIQKKLKIEFDLTLTFMDVRLLLLDLGAAVQDKPQPVEKKTAPPPVAPPPADDPYAEEFDEPAPLPSDQAAPHPENAIATNVTMTLDRLVVPGTMVSGNATFSDGAKARWLIDQYGRFGLEPETPGYRPSNADLQAFQTQLRAELKRNGYA